MERRFRVNGRIIREIVNQLRCEGKPICSDGNGYYYASNEKELIQSISQLSNRIGKIAKTKNGLVRALSLFTDENDQIKLELEEVREMR